MRCLVAIVIACTALGCQHDSPAPATTPAKTAQPAPVPAVPPDQSETAPPPPAGTTNVASSGIQQCDDLVALYVKFMHCDKLPAEAQQGMQQGFDAMTQSLAQLKDVPQDTKDKAIVGCQQGADALKQSASSTGCPL